MNSTIFLITVVLILTLNIVLAFIKKGKGKIKFISYAAEPNKYNFKIISLTLAGTIVGGGMFLAVGQMGYESKYVGIVLGLVYIIGLSLMGFLSKHIREMMKQQKCYTLLDFLSLNFSKKVLIQFTIVNLIMYLFLLSSQFVAIFDFMSFLESKDVNISIVYSLVGLAMLAIIIYPIIGGLRKDIQTDVIQMTTIFIVVGIITYFLIGQDVFQKVYLSNEFHNPEKSSYGIIFIIGAFVFLTPSFLVRMDIWQRLNSAKSNKDTKYGFIIAGFISLVFFFLFTTLGSYANVLEIPNSKFATLNTLYSLFSNPILLGFIIGGFFVAILSSADTLINNVSLFATKLLFIESDFSKKDGNEKLLKYSRITALAFVGLSIILSILIRDIVDLLIGAFSLLLIFLPTIIGLFRKHNNSNAAFYSAFFGLLTFIILFVLWNPKMAFVPSVLVSFIVYFGIFIISKMLKKRTNIA